MSTQRLRAPRPYPLRGEPLQSQLALEAHEIPQLIVQIGDLVEPNPLRSRHSRHVWKQALPRDRSFVTVPALSVGPRKVLRLLPLVKREAVCEVMLVLSSWITSEPIVRRIDVYTIRVPCLRLELASKPLGDVIPSLRTHLTEVHAFFDDEV